MMIVGWLVVMAILLVIEFISLGLTTIWFAAGALAALVIALLQLPIWLQAAVFAVVSVLMLLFTRPVAVKYLNSKTVKTNAESVVGQTARATELIDNIEGTGTVKVGGIIWTARSVDDAVRIPEGTLVMVDGINGVKLIVRPIQEPEVPDRR